MLYIRLNKPLKLMKWKLANRRHANNLYIIYIYRQHHTCFQELYVWLISKIDYTLIYYSCISPGVYNLQLIVKSIFKIDQITEASRNNIFFIWYLTNNPFKTFFAISNVQNWLFVRYFTEDYLSFKFTEKTIYFFKLNYEAWINCIPQSSTENFKWFSYANIYKNSFICKPFVYWFTWIFKMII